MKDVNKYKIVSLILTVALLATMARLVYSTKVGVVKECDKTDIVINNILSRRSVRSFPTSLSAVAVWIHSYGQPWRHLPVAICVLGSLL